MRRQIPADKALRLHDNVLAWSRDQFNVFHVHLQLLLQYDLPFLELPVVGGVDGAGSRHDSGHH